MTDKVQRIREEVERLRKIHQMKYQQLDTDSSISLVECGKRNLCNELLRFINSMKEEPVSEYLEEAAFDYAEACKYEGGEKLLCVEHFKAGAQWQKEQDQSTIELAEDHAMLAGMEKMREEMMAKAVDGGCFSYKNGFVHISCDVDERVTNIKFGDKVKVIVIKED